MALTAGTRLGPYEIVSPAGAGGMGEVYRARDTRLERTVAIKVLPEQFSKDPDLRQRFEREARIISQLQHPHICVLHDVGRDGSTDFLVMEFLEGESLADRLKKGPLPVTELLKIASQVADALEKAHRAGVVHRDLKPGNVMLTKSGAKLMDFGLAKPTGSVTGSGTAPLLSAARTASGPSPLSPLTSAGSIVGTVQYMAPEQIEGKEADARSDIFAFGALLYEMATGQRAFVGKSQLSVASAILEKDPEPISKLRPMTPPALEQLVKGCVAKDPDERFQTAHDVKLQLQWIAEDGSSGVGVAPPVSARRRHREWLAWGVAAVALVLGAALMQLWQRETAPAPAPVVSYLPSPDNTSFVLTDDDTAGPVVISPSGRQIAFVAMDGSGRKQIWVRDLSEGTPKAVAGTDGGTYPFWSPDEKWLGFFADAKLRKVPVNGGPVLDLADAPRGRGGSWSESGEILFAPTTQTNLFLVSASGGTPRPVTHVQEGVHTTHRWPLWLPAGKRFLYLATNHATPQASERNGIYVASVDGTENRMLLPAESNVAVAGGYVLTVQNGTLMAQGFDAKRAELRGDPLPVAQSVIRNPGTWRACFDASQNGVLVFQAGSANFGSELRWFSPGAKEVSQTLAASEREGGNVGSFGEMRLSPDGKRLAVVMGDPQPAIWIYDLARGVRTRFTFEGIMDASPVWSPDGRRLAFSQHNAPGKNFDLYVKDASGTGKQELIYSDKTDKIVSDWSPDGRYLLYAMVSATQNGALYLLPLAGEHTPQLLLQGKAPFELSSGTFSPDGKWVAYVSRESGRFEVYITNFPQPRGKWQVSVAGGTQPRWRRDSKALLYTAPDRTVMLAPITLHGDSVEIGAVQPYVKTTAVTPRYGHTFDLAPDGRVLVNSTMGQEGHTITMITNWTVGLKR